MLKIKTYNEPTTIFIIGQWFENLEATFGTTDDYDCITVEDETHRIGLETDGWVYILTEEELLTLKDSIEIDEYDDIEFMILKDYIGNIELGCLNEKGVDYLKPDVNLDEYIRYQTTESDNEYVHPTLKVNKLGIIDYLKNIQNYLYGNN